MARPCCLAPGGGKSILDLCASPGRKTNQISAMMENRRLVTAIEPSLARISALRSNCDRLGAMRLFCGRSILHFMPTVLKKHQREIKKDEEAPDH